MFIAAVAELYMFWTQPAEADGTALIEPAHQPTVPASEPGNNATDFVAAQPDVSDTVDPALPTSAQVCWPAELTEARTCSKGTLPPGPGTEFNPDSIHAGPSPKRPEVLRPAHLEAATVSGGPSRVEGQPPQLDLSPAHIPANTSQSASRTQTGSEFIQTLIA